MDAWHEKLVKDEDTEEVGEREGKVGEEKVEEEGEG